MSAFLTRQKRRLKSATVANKILLIVIASSLLSMAIITSSSIYRDFRITVKRELNQLSSISSVLANNTGVALRFQDQETAKDYLESLQSEENITCAQLFDADGDLFAEYHRDLDCPKQPYPNALGGKASLSSFSYAASVELNEQQLGVISLHSDAAKLWNELGTSMLIYTLITLFALATALVLARRLLPIITGPVEELANLAHRVSEEKNYGLRAQKRNDDEIGMLVDSVNFMLATVRQRDQAINETNRNLEKLVADRTAKLVEARERAEAALESKSDFLATMSHELRTPLNAIIGMSSVLQNDDLDDNRSRQIEIIRKSAINLLDLINDILDYSKIEANRLDLESSPFDLVACIEEAMDITAAAKKNNRLVYCTQIDPQLPTHVKGDVTRLRQILVNLLGNAFKFTHRGFVTLEAIHVPSDRTRSERIQISIRDSGVGIPDDRIENIFDSFVQAHHGTTREFGGSGLGLTISYRLALAMGGDIKVESELGTGSVFNLTIPIHRIKSLDSLVGKPLLTNETPTVALRNLPRIVDASIRSNLIAWGCHILGENERAHTTPDLSIASALHEDEYYAIELATRVRSDEPVILIAHPDHAPAVRKATTASVLTLPIRNRDLRNLLLKYIDSSESPTLDHTAPFAAYPTEQWVGLRILLAEDNELSRNVFVHHMELIGLEIDTAENGSVARDKALEKDYDIIFMDVRMPFTDGLTATRDIRESKDDDTAPWIVGFTANTEPEAVEDIKKSGMNDYLTKPALIGDIADAINRYFHRNDESALSS